ncbi:MAG TPA: CbiX/SirB N-terminal domain-containing protein [Bdellovibrionota bacterium]|nr:CbiX/SirB N-terminal domain-containing protein [Bdellovibrionota bacterium]
MSSAPSNSAVILLAHGTREPDASRPVHQYAEELSKASGLRVEPCLREFIEPSVSTVVGKLAHEGVRTVYIVPFFLFNSGHVTRDIQKDLAAEKEKYPNMVFKVGEPLGFDPDLVSILKKKLGQIIRS